MQNHLNSFPSLDPCSLPLSMLLPWWKLQLGQQLIQFSIPASWIFMEYCVIASSKEQYRFVDIESSFVFFTNIEFIIDIKISYVFFFSVSSQNVSSWSWTRSILWTGDSQKGSINISDEIKIHDKNQLIPCMSHDQKSLCRSHNKNS